MVLGDDVIMVLVWWNGDLNNGEFGFCAVYYAF